MEMKFIRSALLIAPLLALQASAQPAPPNPATATAPPPAATVPKNGLIQMPQNLTPPPMPEKGKMSYAIGMSVGNSIKREQLEVDTEALFKGLKDALAGNTNQMSEGEMRSTLQQLAAANRAKMQQLQREKMQKESAENKAKGAAFLASNAKAEGVKTLPNGLQYRVLKEGSGDLPKTNDSVTVNYKGKLVDGTSFDSRTNWSTPVVGRTIKAWSEVLPMMKVGSEWEIVVPPELAYGQGGRPPKIGPSSTLVFDIELVGIAPSKATTTPLSVAQPGAPSGPTAVSGQVIRVPSAEEMKKGAKIEVITNVPPSQ